jgi:hypothetical protein
LQRPRRWPPPSELDATVASAVLTLHAARPTPSAGEQQPQRRPQRRSPAAQDVIAISAFRRLPGELVGLYSESTSRSRGREAALAPLRSGTCRASRAVAPHQWRCQALLQSATASGPLAVSRSPRPCGAAMRKRRGTGATRLGVPATVRGRARVVQIEGRDEIRRHLGVPHRLTTAAPRSGDSDHHPRWTVASGIEMRER